MASHAPQWQKILNILLTCNHMASHAASLSNDFGHLVAAWVQSLACVKRGLLNILCHTTVAAGQQQPLHDHFWRIPAVAESDPGL